jgi:hypothetical protein
MVQGPLGPMGGGGGDHRVGSTPPLCTQVAPSYVGTGGMHMIPLMGWDRVWLCTWDCHTYWYPFFEQNDPSIQN